MRVYFMAICILTGAGLGALVLAMPWTLPRLLILVSVAMLPAAIWITKRSAAEV